MGDELRNCGCNNNNTPETCGCNNNNNCCDSKFLFFILIFILLFIDK